MIDQNLHNRAMRKVATLNESLSARHGVEIDFNSGVDHLVSVLKHYSKKREHLLVHLGEGAALKHPDYTKAVLISESVRMYLREVAPKRVRKKKH